ncbi:unnamed protein product [Closterium sp. NIES-54]
MQGQVECRSSAKVTAQFTQVCAHVSLLQLRIQLVGVELRRGSAPVVVSASSSSSALVTSPPPQQLREWYAARQRGGGTGPCTYVLRTGDRTGEQCGGAHPTHHCFGRLTDAWRHQFPEATEIPRWGELSRAGVAIFDLDFDAILAAILLLKGAGEAAALGASEAAALGASTSASSGTGESALSGTASASASRTFTLDSGASRSFFRDRTTLTPLGRPVAVSLADPSGGPVLAHFSTVLPCPAAPSGTLSGLYLPSFSTNLRSSQGYTFSLGSGSVSWRATRSSSVLGSSCEAEIYAGAMAAQELRWLTYLLTDFGEVPRSPPVLYVDNKAMLALCREQRLEHRTKHIALRYFLACELQQRGQLRLAYVASEANTADIFTKALAPCDHQRFCTHLGLAPILPHFLTS